MAYQNDTSFCAIFLNTTFGGSSMLRKKIVGALLLALCLSLAGQSTQAQPAQEFQPQVGQEGKDVIWVPKRSALNTIRRWSNYRSAALPKKASATKRVL